MSPNFYQPKTSIPFLLFFQTTYLRQLTTTATAHQPPTTSTPCCRKPEPASRKNSSRQRAATFNRCKKNCGVLCKKKIAVVSRSLFFGFGLEAHVLQDWLKLWKETKDPSSAATTTPPTPAPLPSRSPGGQPRTRFGLELEARFKDYEQKKWNDEMRWKRARIKMTHHHKHPCPPFNFCCSLFNAYVFVVIMFR